MNENEVLQPNNPELEGKQFTSLAEVKSELEAQKHEGQDWGQQYLVIHGKRLHKRAPKTEGSQSYYDLVDDPSSSVNAMFGRRYDNKFSMNIYDGQEIAYWFNITDENVADYRIDVGQVDLSGYRRKL